MPRRLPRYLASSALLAIFLAHVVGLLQLPILQQLENYAYDLRLRMTLPERATQNIFIVDIDERSLKAEGHWPWSRRKLARLVDRLFEDYKIKVLGFDMVFAERDEAEELSELTRLARDRGQKGFARQLDGFRQELSRDRRLADSFRGRQIVLGYVFHDPTSRDESTGKLPEPLFRVQDIGPNRLFPVETFGYSANLDALQTAAGNAGFFTNPLNDEDGIFRRAAILQLHEGALYESLSLAVARSYTGGGVVLGTEKGPWKTENYPSVEWLELDQKRVPLDGNAGALIPYQGPAYSFTYVSATDVLHRKRNPAIPTQAGIALVGASALGLFDLRATPVGGVYPGVEVHANLVAGMLSGQFKHRPAYLWGGELVTLLLLGLLLTLVLPRLSPLAAAGLVTGVLVVVVVSNLLLWTQADLVFPLATTVALVVVVSILNLVFAFFIETRSKRHLGRLFGQYVPPELVEEMSRNPEGFTLAGERREMTVMFTDIRGFTQFSEALDPRELAQLLNEYLTWLTRIIQKHRGTIDKYMGDGVMAFWGAPLRDPEHAAHAVAASLELLARLDEIHAQFAQRGWPEIRIGVGINTGVMNVGNMGSDFRMAYTVVGDVVNTASRLEALTKEYGVTIVVGETSCDQCPGIAFRELDRVQVKGREQSLSVHEPLGSESELSEAQQQELSAYQQGLKYYRRQEWDLAELQFINLAQGHPGCGLYPRYLERVQQLRDSPPPDGWTGTFVQSTK